jgi:hypothetical protein
VPVKLPVGVIVVFKTCDDIGTGTVIVYCPVADIDAVNNDRGAEPTTFSVTLKKLAETAAADSAKEAEGWLGFCVENAKVINVSDPFVYPT